MSPRRWIQTDLAPGDHRASRLDVSALELQAVHGSDDPAFAPAYRFLAEKFGQTGALESVDVLAQRFAWPCHAQADGWTLKYELLSISDGAGNIAAVRDHTAAVPPANGSEAPQVIVHLSHVLVAEHWRRSGLGGWLRALPLQAAQECLRASGCEAETATITLVAEMEAAPAAAHERPASLLAYEKAGFRKLDPARVPYAQPDFRAPAEIDRTGGPRPLPFSLVIRQVGREDQTHVSGAQARSLARGLYRIYRDGCRALDLAPLLAGIENDYPKPGERVALVPPSAA
jgi:GNAT superfamily N-acetyltransferase